MSNIARNPFEIPLSTRLEVAATGAEDGGRTGMARMLREFAADAQQLEGAVSLLRNARLILGDHGQEDGDNCEECREMVAEIDAYLGGAVGR